MVERWEEIVGDAIAKRGRLDPWHSPWASDAEIQRLEYLAKRIAELEAERRVVSQMVGHTDDGVDSLASSVSRTICGLRSHIAQLEAERRWIPMSEREPDRDGPCLALHGGRPVYRILSLGLWLTASGLRACTPEFWMPIPPPEVTDAD